MSTNPYPQTPPHGGQPRPQHQPPQPSTNFQGYQKQQHHQQPAIYYGQQLQQQQIPPPHPIQTNGPYQVVQAQLSPPPSSRGRQPQPPNQVSSGPTTTAILASSLTPAASNLAGKMQNLFAKTNKDKDGPNCGFVVTEKLAQQHLQTMTTQRQQQQNRRRRPLYQYQVTKLRTWRTGYTRILALYEDSLATLDPDTGAETNRWPYQQVADWLALPKEPDTILLQVNAPSSSEKLKFCIHGGVSRSMLLTNLLQLQDMSAQLPASETMIVSHAERCQRHGRRQTCDLHIKPYGILEVSSATQQTIRVYRFVDLLGCSLLGDAGMVLTFQQPHKSRLWFLSTQTTSLRSQVLTRMGENMALLGLSLQLQESLKTADEWLSARQSIAIGTVAMTWQVTKTTPRHDSKIVGAAPDGWVGGIVTRELLVTGLGYLVERDGVGVVSVRKLSELMALVRHAEQSNQVTLEYANGLHQTYTCGNRDALLVSLLDAAATMSGNTTIHISDVPIGNYCLCSLASSTKETVAAQPSLFQPVSIPDFCHKKLQTIATQTFAFVSGQFAIVQQDVPPVDFIEQYEGVVQACREFNASVLPTGEGLADAGNKSICATVGALWGLVGKLLLPLTEGVALQNMHEKIRAEATASVLFQALYRLSQTPAGYKGTIELTTFQEAVLLLWGIDDAYCKFSAFQVLNVLLSGRPVRDLEAEYVNKSIIFKGVGQALVEGIITALVERTRTSSDVVPGRDNVSGLVLMAASDILQSILCTYHDTTSPEHFNAFIVALSDRYRSLLNMLRAQTPSVIENTALLLHLLSSHAPQTAAAIRDAALSSSILLQHFYAAIFNPLEGQRFLSRYLCSLWMSGPMDCDEKRLLKRMVPAGFMSYLSMPLLSPMEEDQLDDLEHDATEENIKDASDRVAVQNVGSSANSAIASASAGARTNTARLRRRIAMAVASAKQCDHSSKPENFRIFFHILTQDNNMPDLVWNQQTRRELRITLENEIQLVARQIDARGSDAVAWNHQQFRVKYPSLNNEVKVGNVYMRLWLNAGEGFIRAWEEPLSLFELLFRKFLCEIDRDSKVAIMCIRCMERLYAIHASKIGPFSDVMILVRSMASTSSIETQHRLLGLLATILGVADDRSERANVPENAEQLLNAESISLLCHFVAWGHTDEKTIGSIMSRTVASGIARGPMIESDASTLPHDAHCTEQRAVSFDSTCPPVWFTAEGSKVPPPANLIKGPYRLSDLVRMVKADEMTSFHLVATRHVEEYDQDVVTEAAEAVTEALIDTGKWKQLHEIWQLRWLCRNDDSSGILTPAAVALLALKSLTRLVELHKSKDSQGVPYYPIPMAKRVLCASSTDISAGARPLSILTQSLLCNSDSLVEQTAELLFKLLEHNEESTPKLYLTGAFFFFCCYTGSNFRSLARLLHGTHLKQTFQSGYAATVDASQLRVKDRSILGNLIPEGLLCVLVNYGFERFAEVFVGTVDTPEVIWTFEMRLHMIEMIRQHLGDFPLRLFQNNTAEYEYCPMPSIAYQRLEKEIFCHNYYLSNLCDEDRFRDWPILDPVEVFRACLEHFTRRVKHDEDNEGIAMEKAQSVLKLNVGDGMIELRKAYRSFARQYHPDKNPTGREIFESIQASYELLLPVLQGGNRIRSSKQNDDASNSSVSQGDMGGMPQMASLGLLIKAQVIICRRYEKEMSRYKYPAYSVLLECMLVPTGLPFSSKSSLHSSLMNPQKAAFVMSAVELIYYTCLVSPPNAQELVQEGGVAKLSALLAFCTEACFGSADKAGSRVSMPTSAATVKFLLRTMAGLAHFESGRSAIVKLEALDVYLRNIRQCIECGSFNDAALGNSVARYALECIAPMARNQVLQEKMVGSGIIWPLLRQMLLYDPSLKDDIHHIDDDDGIVGGISVSTTNLRASLAVKALGALSGAVPETQTNTALTSCLNRLLTKSVARMLRNKRTTEILRVLNTNMESADIIWNDAMRKQLQSTLDEIESQRNTDTLTSVEDELAVVSTFEFEALRNEIQIGGIYVRMFNKSGREAISRIPDPSSFLTEILATVAEIINKFLQPEERLAIHIHSDGTSTQLGSDDASLLEVLRVLRTLVQTDGLFENVLADMNRSCPSIFMELLRLPVQSECFEIVCDILSGACSRRDFADAVAADGALWRLLAILQHPELGETNDMAGERAARGWLFLEGLVSSPSIADQLLASSAWLEVLGVLVGYADFTKLYASRLGAAKILSRLMWDPSTGAIATASVERCIPSTLAVILKEAPENMITQFDGNADTPELVWNSSMRSELRKSIASQLDSMLQRRERGTTAELKLDNFVNVKYTALDKELYIGGVYVSRFIKDPAFNLRNPSHFLESLLKRWEEELASYATGTSALAESNCTVLSSAKQDVLLEVTSAIVYLCKVRDLICDKLADWGYMQRCISALQGIISKNLTGTPLISIMRVLHVASNRLANVEALARTGDSSGKAGIVDLTLQAIGFDGLHEESGFMVEMLKNVFRNAIGDAKRPKRELMTAYPAPSPAPGDGSVRQKVLSGDDPLAMMGLPSSSAPSQQASVSSSPSTQEQLLSLRATFSNAAPPFGSHAPVTQPYGGFGTIPPLSFTSAQMDSATEFNRSYPSQGSSQQGAYPYHSVNPSQVSNIREPLAATSTVSTRSEHPYRPLHQSIDQHQQQPHQLQQILHTHNHLQTISGRNSASAMVGIGSAPFQDASTSTGPEQVHFVHSDRNLHPSPLAYPPYGQYSQHSTGSPPSHGAPTRIHQSHVSPLSTTSQPWQGPAIAYGSQRSPEQSKQTCISISEAHPRETMLSHEQSLGSKQEISTSGTSATNSESTLLDHKMCGNGYPQPQMSSFIFESRLGAQYDSAKNDSTAAASHDASPPVKTNSRPPLQYGPNAVEGAGIDARTNEDPRSVAEKHAVLTGGAPNSAQGRVSLFQQALCFNLCTFMIERILENSELCNVKDPVAAKTHAIDLLKILTTDPGYGPKFKLILDDIPAWKKYKLQDHSLFLAGKDQRSDFLLTQGSSDPKRLLTESEK